MQAAEIATGPEVLRVRRGNESSRFGPLWGAYPGDTQEEVRGRLGCGKQVLTSPMAGCGVPDIKPVLSFS